MKTLGNILWHVPFLGFLSAIMAYLLGVLLTATVVAAPIGLGLMELGKFLFAPFGHALVSRSDLKVEQNKSWKAYSTVIMILYLPFGAVLALLAIFQVAFLFLSIIGIPVALVVAKSLGTFFNPVNKKCVHSAVVGEIERRAGQAEVEKYLGSTSAPKADLTGSPLPITASNADLTTQRSGSSDSSQSEITPWASEQVDVLPIDPGASTGQSPTAGTGVHAFLRNPGQLIMGVAIIAALLLGYLGYRNYESNQEINRMRAEKDSLERAAQIEAQARRLAEQQSEAERQARLAAATRAADAERKGQQAIEARRQVESAEAQKIAREQATAARRAKIEVEAKRRYENALADAEKRYLEAQQRANQIYQRALAYGQGRHDRAARAQDRYQNDLARAQKKYQETRSRADAWYQDTLTKERKTYEQISGNVAAKTAESTQSVKAADIEVASEAGGTPSNRHGESQEFGSPAMGPIQSSQEGYVSKMLSLAMVDGGVNNEDEILEAKRRDEELQRPQRGDRKAARAVNERGLASLQSGRTLEAINAFQEAHKADPGDVEILNNLGYAYLMQGDLDPAERYMLSTLTMAPGRTSAWANLGEVYAKKGDINAAVGSFANAYRFSQNRDKTHQFFLTLMEKENGGNLKQALQQIIQLAEGKFLLR